ncbi:MAG: hypothetical protein WCL08_11880 [Verrucomicrobiota bacterium]
MTTHILVTNSIPACLINSLNPAGSTFSGYVPAWPPLWDLPIYFLEYTQLLFQRYNNGHMHRDGTFRVITVSDESV